MPILRSNIVASLAEFGKFEEIDGGELDIQENDYYPAGAQTPDKLLGPHTYTDITLQRGYDPRADDPIEDWVKAYKLGKELPRTLTITSSNAQGVIVKTRSYEAKPKGYAPPGGKAGDGSVGMMRLVLSVRGNSF